MSLGFSARLNFRFGPKAVLQAGLLMLAAGLAWMVRAPVGASYAVDLLPAMVLLGVGAGLSFPALMTLAMSGATPGDSGLASGLVNTTVQVGGALGLAVLATLSTTRTAHLVASGEGHASALTGGYHLAWIISAGVALVSLAISAPVLRSVRLGEGDVPGGQETEVNSLDVEPSYAEAA
jgi:MFS family permease